MFARFWTAPVLWRFGDGFEMDDGRSLVPAQGFKTRITIRRDLFPLRERDVGKHRIEFCAARVENTNRRYKIATVPAQG
jgi:hypothetical protein